MPPKRKSSSSVGPPSKKAKVPKPTSNKKTSAGKKSPKKAKLTKSVSVRKAKPKENTTVKKVAEVTPLGVTSKGSDLLMYLLDDGWLSLLKQEFEQDYFKQIETQLSKDYKSGIKVFPPVDLIFNAFNKTPLCKLKVVILGQDPYHDDGQAMGLSFSVPSGKALPPSLKNIYKELVNDKDIKNFNSVPDSGCLTKWAERGVLLLNATLTVEAHKPNSHAKYGWQQFTDNVIRTISDKLTGIVFVLWGNFAHKKEKLIDGTKHSVIKTAHPSPLSFNKWLGCKCFSEVNNELKKWVKSEIDWTVD